MNKHFTPLVAEDETVWFTHKNKNITALMYALITHANRKRGAWKGISIGRGEWVLSQKGFAEKFNVSISTLRYTLKQLEKMGLIKLETHEGFNGFTKVSILHYDDYVLSEKAEQGPEYRQYQEGMEIEDGEIIQF